MNNPKQKIIDFYSSNKRMPSYGEMLKLFNYRTKSAVDYAVRKLIKTGLIKKDKKGKLIPNNILNDIKILGLVEAGFPSPAEEELVDTINLDDYLVPNKDSSYILKVKGDSMEGAGIVEGDMVIAERGKNPKPGDIVIAEVDGEFTMKYFRQKSGKSYLEAANPKYKLIYPENELKITAIVKAVVRKY